MSSENLIYLNGFWDGFSDKSDGCNFGFFEQLFCETISLRHYQTTCDLNIANVLLESVFGTGLTEAKEWKYKIHFSGESRIFPERQYDLILSGINTDRSTASGGKSIELPQFLYYLYNNDLLSRIKKNNSNAIPKKFCCFIVSNGGCETRNRMFHRLSEYKKVDSLGRYQNNIGKNINHNYWTESYRNIISEYKFIICFENAKADQYITEKIVNPYLAGTIPIYWSTHHIKKVFNPNSMIFLEDEGEASYQNLIRQVIELDLDDEKYLNFLNQEIFNTDNKKYWNENYTLQRIASKIDAILLRRNGAVYG